MRRAQDARSNNQAGADASPLEQCNNITYVRGAMCFPVPPSASRTSLRRRLDHLGIGLAGLCAVHCLATLLLVSALGLGGHFLLDQNIHRVGLAMALAVAVVAIGWGLWRHRRPLPFAIAATGIGFMAWALLVPHGANEFVLTLLGVTLVSIAHFLNLRATH
jgi:hypothetical protein